MAEAGREGAKQSSLLFPMHSHWIGKDLLAFTLHPFAFFFWQRDAYCCFGPCAYIDFAPVGFQGCAALTVTCSFFGSAASSVVHLVLTSGSPAGD